MGVAVNEEGTLCTVSYVRAGGLNQLQALPKLWSEGPGCPSCLCCLPSPAHLSVASAFATLPFPGAFHIMHTGTGKVDRGHRGRTISYGGF